MTSDVNQDSIRR